MPRQLRNEEVKRVLRCSDDELARLKDATKQQMQETHINGGPLIGALFSEVDRDGAVRDSMWQLVAESDPTFRALLSGARWGTDLPANFHQRLKSVKWEILRRFNGPFRHLAKKRARTAQVMAGSQHSDEQEPSRKLRRRSGRPQTATDVPTAEDDDPTDGSASNANNNTRFVEHRAFETEAADNENDISQSMPTTRSNSPQNRRICVCNDVPWGTMIACDNVSCVKEWFHLPCAGLEELPRPSAKWYCMYCSMSSSLPSSSHLQTTNDANKTSETPVSRFTALNDTHSINASPRPEAADVDVADTPASIRGNSLHFAHPKRPRKALRSIGRPYPAPLVPAAAEQDRVEGQFSDTNDGAVFVEHRDLESVNNDTDSSANDTRRASDSETHPPDSAMTDLTESSDIQAQPIQYAGAARPTLSERIQQAVDSSMTYLQAKITKLDEASSTQEAELVRREAELEHRLLQRVEIMLSQRDAEIEGLKADWEAERSWRV